MLKSVAFHAQGRAFSLDFVVHGNLTASEAAKELQARLEKRRVHARLAASNA